MLARLFYRGIPEYCWIPELGYFAYGDLAAVEFPKAILQEVNSGKVAVIAHSHPAGMGVDPSNLDMRVINSMYIATGGKQVFYPITDLTKVSVWTCLKPGYVASVASADLPFLYTLRNKPYGYDLADLEAEQWMTTLEPIMDLLQSQRLQLWA